MSQFLKLAFPGMMIAALLGAGCATMADVISAKDAGEGTSQVYEVTNQQAWDISRHVFRWSGADAIEEHPDEHYMLTSSSRRPFSGAAYMGAWVESVDAQHTKVTVVTKRKKSYSITTTLTETGFQSDFAKGVAIIKSGKPLPVAEP